MDTLFSFLIEFFWHLWPFNIVRPWQQGLLVVCGRWTRTLQPGIYVRLPLLMEIETMDVKERVVDLGNQPLTTLDGVTFMVSGAIQFEIYDLKTLYLNVQDHEESLQTRAMIEVAKVAAQSNWDELTLEYLGEEITPYVQHPAVRWGIRVSAVSITHLAESSCQYVTGDNTVGTLTTGME